MSMSCLCFVCLCVCLSTKISPGPQTRSLPNFLCMLLMAVARSSFGFVAIRYVLPALWMKSCSFSIMGCIVVWISLRKKRFRLNLLIYLKSARIQFPIIKWHNLDYFEITCKDKEEQRKLTINGKNYRNARHRSYCYYDNGKRWRRNKYTSEFNAWTWESEVNLALMGLRLKNIELRKNSAAENYSGPSTNIPPKLRNSRWTVCSGHSGYLKHDITTDAFIALQNPVRGAQVLWLVCLCIFVCLSSRISLDLHVRLLQNFWCMLFTVVAQAFSGEGGGRSLLSTIALLLLQVDDAILFDTIR